MIDFNDYLYQYIIDLMTDFSIRIDGNIEIYNQSLPENQADVFILVRSKTSKQNKITGEQTDTSNILVQSKHDTDSKKICLHLLEKISIAYNIELREPESGEHNGPLRISIIENDGMLPLGDVGMGRFQRSINLKTKTSLIC